MAGTDRLPVGRAGAGPLFRLLVLPWLPAEVGKLAWPGLWKGTHARLDAPSFAADPHPVPNVSQARVGHDVREGRQGLLAAHVSRARPQRGAGELGPPSLLSA